MVDEAVTPEHIAAVVVALDRHPGRRMLEGERAKLLQMEENLRRRVVGQDEAVVAVVERDPARARRAAGPEPADRLVPVPRARPASARPS